MVWKSKNDRAIAESFRNDYEAHALLDLINVEFRTDPRSVQFFDRRIVERVAYCVALHKKHKEDGVF